MQSVSTIKAARPGSARVDSLDIFRGMTIAAMIVVNNPGNHFAFRQLQHSEWNGCTLTDLVFPFFLFIVGVSLVFSFDSRRRRGATSSELSLHTVRRSAALFVIGLFLNAFPKFQFATLRIPGVLQRIAVAYLAAALVYLYVGRKAQLTFVAGILISYWVLLRYAPVPGAGLPGVEVTLFAPHANLVSFIDGKLFGIHALTPTDPMGLLSTLPAIANVLIGCLIGQKLREAKPQPGRLILLGVLLITVGVLWSAWLPINKKLWTSSYTLFSSGWAIVCFVLLYWICDQRRIGKIWKLPFIVLGTNALAVYIFSELLGSTLHTIRVALKESQSVAAVATLGSSPPSGHFAYSMYSLVYSLFFLGICYVPAWVLWRRRVFLKL